MINIIKKNIYLCLLLLSVLLMSCLILYKIPLNGLYYFSSLGDTKEQYVHFFNHFYDYIHKGNLPFWSWEYGMGGSFWNDFGYYMLGDIFIWPMFLLPKTFFPALFLPMTIIKMLLMSIGAYLFFKKTGVHEQWSFLGALIYPFAGYHFDYFYTHYFFINAAVYFPFLLLGYERFLQHKKPGLLIFVVFFASIGNFYLMFLLSIGLFIYAIFRFFHQKTIHKTFINFLTLHAKLSLSYLIGLGISMPFFLPSVLSYLQSNAQVRSGPEFEFVLNFEETIERISITGGMHYIIFAVVPLLIFRFKKTYPLLILCGLLWSIMQFPILTSIIGGFSRPEELRGFFIINLLSIFLAIQILNQLKRNYIDSMALSIGIILVTLWLLKHPYTRYDELLLITPIIWLVGLLLFLFLKSKKIKSFIFILSTFIGVGYSAVIAYSFTSDLIVKTKYPDTQVTFHKGVWSTLPLLNKESYNQSYNKKDIQFTFNQLEDRNQFQRVIANIPGAAAINSSLTYDYNSFYSYHSLIPWKQQKFEMDTLAQPGLRGFNLLRGFGNSTYLTTLFSNRYYISNKNSPKLFGYNLEKSYGDLSIYKNQYFLPLGFVYDKAMSTDQFLSLPVYQREQAMMNYAIIDNVPLRDDLKFNAKMISDINDITINSETPSSANNIKIKSEKPIEIKIPTPIQTKGQLYVYANIIPHTPNNGITMIAKKDDLGEINYVKNMRNRTYIVSQYSYENTVNEVLFRFGEIQSQNKAITLSLLPGEYIVKDIKVFLDPMVDYKKQVNKLKQNTLQNIKRNSYSLSGTLTTNKSGTLFLSIPYNKGWFAKVDGKKADIFPAHYTYTGISVTKGTHKIELYFIPPGLVTGIIICVLSIIFLIFYCNIRKKQGLTKRH